MRSLIGSRLFFFVLLVVLGGILPSFAMAQEGLFVPAPVEGTQFIAGSTGIYRFEIKGGAYEDCPPECQIQYPGTGGWRTEILIYENRQIEWSGGEISVPTNWDFSVGDRSPQPTYEEAEQIGEGMFVNIPLLENEYVILVVNDCKGCFQDNSGGIYLTAFIQCDFSLKPGIERCFGGQGSQCQGYPEPFYEDQNTCLVEGYMSVGSTLHDRCCVTTNNTGFMCAQPKNFQCKNEFLLASYDFVCGRFWFHTFGPYPVGNTGDNINQDFIGTAPAGTHVDLINQDYCSSGKCRVNAKGKTIIKRDLCGRYCECQ